MEDCLIIYKNPLEGLKMEYLTIEALEKRIIEGEFLGSKFISMFIGQIDFPELWDKDQVLIFKGSPILPSEKLLSSVKNPNLVE